MLQFPAWKVALIVAVLLWGGFLALPNLFSDSFLGVKPRPPANESPKEIAEYTVALAEAEQSWWPGALPKGKLNLGLDLRGGVYLLMEIDPDEVVANQLQIFLGDIRNETNKLNPDRITYPTPEVENGQFTITLNNPSQLDQALARIRRLNTPVAGALGGQTTYEITSSSSGLVTVRVSDAARSALARDAQRKTQDVVRRRVDPDGVAEVGVLPQGETRLVLEAPGEADPERLKDVLGQAGRMTFSLVDQDPDAVSAAFATGRARPGWRLLTDRETGERLLVSNTPIVTGADIATANQGFDQNNRPNVEFRLNSAGARRFGDATAQNRGRLFAIVLDEQIMSAPRINEPIYGGQVQITGTFSIEEANNLAAIIEAGELPAKLEFIEERTIGPGLGADSIRAGTLASIIGLVLVAAFMALTYRTYGLFAVLSLAANVILILGALSGLGATLTLPGIAGIILTIGMAVDANVLVFERIREEQRSGRSPLTAVQAGYERALSTILDANITTFIAAAVLYVGAGGGPVGGFAVTLAIGILTSVFTAFVVTRWFTVTYLRAARPQKLAI